MSLMTKTEYCGCEQEGGKSLCAECEGRINLAEQAGLVFADEWEGIGKPVFIGDREAWNKFHELLERSEQDEAHDCDNIGNCTFCWELKNK